MNKKILVINASPRKGGHIARLLEYSAVYLRNRGYSIRTFNVAEAQYRFCTGCMACRKRGECVLPEDDADRLGRLLEECDRIVIGVPCYWGNMPGQLKGLFDRLVYKMMSDNESYIPRPLMKGKRAIIISTSTTPWPWNRLFHQTSGVVRALKEIFRYSGIKVAATFQKGNTRGKAGITHSELSKLNSKLQRLNIESEADFF